MTPMTEDQVQQLLDAVGPRTRPSGAELLPGMAALADQVRRLHTPDSLSGRLGRHTPAVLRRLADTEADLATLRHLLADLLADLVDGDEVTTADVQRRLAAAGICLDAEVEQAIALRTARATAGAW